jgi:hypothetical protein
LDQTGEEEEEEERAGTLATAKQMLQRNNAILMFNHSHRPCKGLLLGFLTFCVPDHHPQRNDLFE